MSGHREFTMQVDCAVARQFVSLWDLVPGELAPNEWMPQHKLNGSSAGRRPFSKGIPVGAKEESWVSAEEILKSLLRDS